MSRENVEVVWRAFEIFARDGLDVVLERCWDPDGEFHDARGLPDARVHYGDGIREAHRQWWASWETPPALEAAGLSG